MPWVSMTVFAFEFDWTLQAVIKTITAKAVRAILKFGMTLSLI